MDIIRGVTIQPVDATSSPAHRVVHYEGRPDEECVGYNDQHYGFRSIPPIGTEVIGLQYDNNNVVIAENSIYGVSNLEGGPLMKDKDTLLYTDSGTSIFLNDASKKITLSSDSSLSGAIILNGIDQKATIVGRIGTGAHFSGVICNSDSNGQVSINDGNLTVDYGTPIVVPPATSQYLANATFVQVVYEALLGLGITLPAPLTQYITRMVKGV